MSFSDLNDSTPIFYNYGIPPPMRDTRKAYQKRLAVSLILASVLLERIAFFTLAINLAVSLESKKQTLWKFENLSIVAFIFIGASNISAVIFAAISDAKLGRVKTTLLGFVLYLIGYILITIFGNPEKGLCESDKSEKNGTQSTHAISGEYCVAITEVALIVIAVGAGAVQSSMAVFGAEQIQESKLTSRFFDKYVIAMNIGEMIGLFTVPLMPDDTESYDLPYLIATLVLVFAAILFLIGQRYYVHVKSDETVMAKCIPVIINAFQSWYKHRKNRRLTEFELKSTAASNESDDIRRSESVSDEEKPPVKFLDFAKATNDGRFIDRIVDDVKSFGTAIGVFALLIPYWLIYNQLHSSFRQQARAMKGAEERTLIIVSFVDPVTIIVGVLILNIFLYNKRDARSWLSALITKFLIGMFCGFVTMCIAGGVEISRRHQWLPGRNESELSFYVQLPQDIGMGVSESFIMVASFEFAYFAAPRSAQSLFMSLRFCSIGVSSFLAVAYVALFPGPTRDLDFSCYSDVFWPSYSYFFILGGLQLTFIVLFYICQKKYQIIKFNPQQIETNQFYRQKSSSFVGSR